MRVVASPDRTWAIYIERKVEDCWIGVFWRRSYTGHPAGYWLDIWICLVPCFPIHVMRFVPREELPHGER